MSLIHRVVIFVLASASLMLAEDRTFQLTGRVTDPSGAVLPNASVKLYNRDSTEAYATTTDRQGAYSLALPQGLYLLEAEAAGFSLAKAPRAVNVDGPQTLPLQLSISALSQSVVVIATGTPQSMDETAKAVTIVDRSELDQRGIEDIADGLREVPGLRISQRGGPGSFTTIQTRGLRTFDTSILVDGVRFRDVAATQGDASSFISDLLLVDTARVEVLRGSGSSLYGTNAIGGVVNLVTDTGDGPFHGALTADGGGLGEFRGLARVGGSAFENRVHYSAGLGHQDVTNGVGGYGRYRNTSGNGSVDYAIRPGLVLSGRLLATDVFGQLYQDPDSAPATNLPPTGYVKAIAPSRSQIKLAEANLPYALGSATFIPALGDPDYFRTARFSSTQVALQQQISAPFSYRVTYQAFLSDRDVVNGPGGPGLYQPLFRNSSEFNGRIDTVRVQANYLAGKHNLVSGGYEFEHENFDSPASDANPDPTQRINSRTQVSELSHAFDAQDQVRLFGDRLQLFFSGRFQHFDLNQPQFLGNFPVYAGTSAISPPNAYTGDVSIAYFIHSTGTKIRSHGGNGYRKPSLYELFGTYFDGSYFSAYGDPRLKPERSIAIDGGVDQYFASDRLRLSASYFYTRLQQVVAFDFSGLIDPATDPFGRSIGYRNTGGGIARGVELSLEAKPLRWTTVRSSYTYTNAKDKYSQFGDGTLQMARITPQSFSLVILQQFGKRVDAALDAVVQSNYLFPFSGRTFVFSGPRQLGLAAGYTQPLTERLNVRFYARINNVNGQSLYEDGFRTPGRWATGGLVFSF